MENNKLREYVEELKNSMEGNSSSAREKAAGRLARREYLSIMKGRQWHLKYSSIDFSENVNINPQQAINYYKKKIQENTKTSEFNSRIKYYRSINEIDNKVFKLDLTPYGGDYTARSKYNKRIAKEYNIDLKHTMKGIYNNYNRISDSLREFHNEKRGQKKDRKSTVLPDIEYTHLYNQQQIWKRAKNRGENRGIFASKDSEYFEQKTIEAKNKRDQIFEDALSRAESKYSDTPLNSLPSPEPPSPPTPSPEPPLPPPPPPAPSQPVTPSKSPTPSQASPPSRSKTELLESVQRFKKASHKVFEAKKMVENGEAQFLHLINPIDTSFGYDTPKFELSNEKSPKLLAIFGEQGQFAIAPFESKFSNERTGMSISNVMEGEISNNVSHLPIVTLNKDGTLNPVVKGKFGTGNAKNKIQLPDDYISNPASTPVSPPQPSPTPKPAPKPAPSPATKKKPSTPPAPPPEPPPPPVPPPKPKPTPSPSPKKNPNPPPNPASPPPTPSSPPPSSNPQKNPKPTPKPAPSPPPAPPNPPPKPKLTPEQKADAKKKKARENKKDAKGSGKNHQNDAQKDKEKQRKERIERQAAKKEAERKRKIEEARKQAEKEAAEKAEAMEKGKVDPPSPDKLKKDLQKTAQEQSEEAQKVAKKVASIGHGNAVGSMKSLKYAALGGMAAIGLGMMVYNRQ